VALARQKNVGDAETALRAMVKKLDTASGKGIIKKNTAARKKSRMQKLFNSLKAAQ
jgi:small subunit ribosomal protein S20